MTQKKGTKKYIIFLVSNVGPNAGGSVTKAQPQPCPFLTSSMTVPSPLGYANSPRSVWPQLFPVQPAFKDQSCLLRQPSELSYSITRNPQMVLTPL